MTAPARDTREKIIVAAERLFARRGIEATSLRQILLAAGQRNASAAAYHFGSKEALLSAVLETRREGINRRRGELVAALRQEGREREPHALVQALVLPLAELLGAGDAENYIRVMAQAIGHPRYFQRVRRSDHGAALEELLVLLRACVPDVPAAILEQRFGMALRQIFHELADFRQLHGGRRDARALPLFIGNLVDAVTGLFCAAVSAGARQELKRAARRTA